MIGLSIPDCCREIAQGRVDAGAVLKIVARTGVQSPGEWETVIRMYRDFFWDKDYADRAEEIFRKFLGEKRIEQPRFTERLIPDTRHGFWVGDESEISWKKV